MRSESWWKFGPPFLPGVGLGGFFDGIIFHQVLRWHHFASQHVDYETLDDLQRNVMIDGIFHTAMWVVTWGRRTPPLAGRPQGALPRALSLLAGLVLLGFGVFNIFDGTVSHLVLNLHNAREGENELAWNLAWIGWGAAFALFGGWLVARSRRAAERSSAPGRCGTAQAHSVGSYPRPASKNASTPTAAA